MAKLPAKQRIWTPPNIELVGVGNGASLFGANNAGYFRSFSSTADDEVLWTVLLNWQGIPYDGSNLGLRLFWQLFVNVPAGGDDVKWEVDYVYILSGGVDDPDSKAATNNVDTIVVDARTDDVMYDDLLLTMTGLADAEVLSMTLRRNSTGGGADSYDGNTHLFGIRLEKV